MCQVLDMSRFLIFQYCQNDRVLNFQGHTGFTYFREYALNCNYGRVQGYSRIAIMLDFYICKRCTRF